MSPYYTRGELPGSASPLLLVEQDGLFRFSVGMYLRQTSSYILDSSLFIHYIVFSTTVDTECLVILAVGPFLLL